VVGQWPDGTPDQRYELLRQTKTFNADFLAMVEQTRDCRPARPRVRAAASWTTMGQALCDDQSYDTLLTYMMLVQSGYPGRFTARNQVEAGFLAGRGYKASIGDGRLRPARAGHDCHSQLCRCGRPAADRSRANSERHLSTPVQPMACPGWAQTTRVYLSNGTPVPVQVSAAPLTPPAGADILARFEDGSPAVCRFAQGAGTVILAGSYLGWDYTNYPGYYDLAAMFPFHIRRDDLLRQWLAGALAEAGVEPPAQSSHPDVEIAVWQAADGRPALLFAINHLQETVTTQIRLRDGAALTAREALNGPAPAEQDGCLTIALEPLQGRIYRLSAR